MEGMTDIQSIAYAVMVIGIVWAFAWVMRG
jgi:hypothetical protein